MFFGVDVGVVHGMCGCAEVASVSTTFMLRRVASRESSLVVLDDDEALVGLGRGLRFGVCAADAKYDAGLSDRLAMLDLSRGRLVCVFQGLVINGSGGQRGVEVGADR